MCRSACSLQSHAARVLLESWKILTHIIWWSSRYLRVVELIHVLCICCARNMGQGISCGSMLRCPIIFSHAHKCMTTVQKVKPTAYERYHMQSRADLQALVLAPYRSPKWTCSLDESGVGLCLCSQLSGIWSCVLWCQVRGAWYRRQELGTWRVLGVRWGKL